VNERELHTVAVFRDAASAEAGLQALVTAGFPVSSLSTVVVVTDASGALGEAVFGGPAAVMEVRGLGRVYVRGAVVDALQGEDAGFAARGLAATAGRLGFQVHDGRIFERLTARGGVLVAVMTAARAADALALLHAYGGGNAAIGAWTGRL
jgi:hypothetical protein